MSFNLIYADKGIDFSGFAEGLSNGLKIRYEQERYERKLFDDEMKQFQLYWKPDKLKPGDKGLYMSTMEEYKNNRKQELRLDKNYRAKPEERQLAYEKSEAAKTKIEKLYGASLMANQWLVDAYKTNETYTKQKIVPPVELLNKIKEVANMPSTEIDFENLLPASSFDVMPSSEEISKYSSSVMDSKLYTESFSAPDPQKPYEEMPSSVPLLGGKKVYFKKEYLKMPSGLAYTKAREIEGTRLENKSTANFNSFSNAMQSEPTSAIKIAADKKANEISSKFGITADKIDKYHLWAYDNGMLNPKFTKDITDDSEVALAMKSLSALNEAERLKVQKQLANSQMALNKTNQNQAKLVKFLTYIGSPMAEAAFKSSEPNNEFLQEFADYGIDGKKFFEEAKKIQEASGNKNLSFIDLYNRVNKTPKQ